MVVLGTPSSSPSSRIFLSATMRPGCVRSLALYTTPYVPVNTAALVDRKIFMQHDVEAAPQRRKLAFGDLFCFMIILHLAAGLWQRESQYRLQWVCLGEISCCQLRRSAGSDYGNPNGVRRPLSNEEEKKITLGISVKRRTAGGVVSVVVYAVVIAENCGAGEVNRHGVRPDALSIRLI